jgi:hypothetical protein
MGNGSDVNHLVLDDIVVCHPPYKCADQES